MINEKQKNNIQLVVAGYQKDYLESHAWELANNVLYDLCFQYPLHIDKDQIVAKIWLIGRSYAAAIERRKNADQFTGYDFYYEAVAPAIAKIGSELDDRIKSMKNAAGEWDNRISLFESHYFLMTEFKKLTELDKRSLASKYLHFHAKEKVYIYDSVTECNIKKLVGKNTKLCNELAGLYDDPYVDFCIRAQELQQYIRDTFNLDLSKRQIDTLLLNAHRYISK